METSEVGYVPDEALKDSPESEMSEGVAKSLGSEVVPGKGQERFDLAEKTERDMAEERKQAARKRNERVQ